MIQVIPTMHQRTRRAGRMSQIARRFIVVLVIVAAGCRGSAGQPDPAAACRAGREGTLVAPAAPSFSTDGRSIAFGYIPITSPSSTDVRLAFAHTDGSAAVRLATGRLSFPMFAASGWQP